MRSQRFVLARGFLAAVVSVALTAIPMVGSGGLAYAAAAVGTGDWPMFGDGPAHNSLNRAEQTLSPSTVSGLHVTGSYPAWSPVFASEGPYEDVVGSAGYSVDPGPISGYNSYLEAFNLPSGTMAWKFEVATANSTWNYVPAVSNGVAYVAGQSYAYAVNATTGKRIWSTSIGQGADANPVTLSGSAVYFSTYYGQQVWALNATTGKVLWSQSPSGCCLDGAVSVANGIAYVANGGLDAYNATTGAPVFTVPTSASVYGTPVVAGGLVFASGNSALNAYNATTGALVWSQPVTPATEEAPAVAGTTMVVAGGSGSGLMALSTQTGRILWSYGSSSDGYSAPAIANGVVYAGSFGHGFQAFNLATGALLYTYSTSYCDAPIDARSAIYDSCDGSVMKFSL